LTIEKCRQFSTSADVPRYAVLILECTVISNCSFAINHLIPSIVPIDSLSLREVPAILMHPFRVFESCTISIPACFRNCSAVPSWQLC